jgi:anaphase-promoting complex subunit 6
MEFLLYQLTASTSHLRGLIHLHLGAADLAKEAFIEALSRDVKCFESFQVLVGSEMMSASEGSSRDFGVHLRLS